jgi:serine protease Do
LVTGITPNSPAEAAQLRAGDVILEFDGVRIQDDRDLVNRVSLTRSGSEVEILILRDRTPTTVKVVVGDRDTFEGSSR